MSKRILTLTALLTLALALGRGNAEETLYDGIAAQVSLSNRSSGIEGADHQAAPQASLTWGDLSGYYASTTVAQTVWMQDTMAFDATVAAGRQIRFGDTAIDVSAGFAGLSVARAARGVPAYEATVRLSRDFGPLTFSAIGARASDDRLDGRTWYGASAVRLTLADWLAFRSDYGYRWADNLDTAHIRWDVGATADWRNISLDVRYVSNGLWAADPGLRQPTGDNAGLTALLTYNILKGF